MRHAHQESLLQSHTSQFEAQTELVFGANDLNSQSGRLTHRCNTV